MKHIKGFRKKKLIIKKKKKRFRKKYDFKVGDYVKFIKNQMNGIDYDDLVGEIFRIDTRLGNDFRVVALSGKFLNWVNGGDIMMATDEEIEEIETIRKFNL